MNYYYYTPDKTRSHMLPITDIIEIIPRWIQWRKAGATSIIRHEEKESIP